MRLTLRTLLAFLNQPNLNLRAAERIEGKVRQSPAARQLMAQVQELAAQPAIPAFAPDSSDPQHDANEVAEYLDNALPDARVPAFEQRCFESPPLLAEIASCHELLSGLCRGETAPVSSSLRQTLYDIGRMTLDQSKLPEVTEVRYLGAAIRPAGVGGVPLPADPGARGHVFDLGPPPEEVERQEEGAEPLSHADLCDLHRRVPARRRLVWAVGLLVVTAAALLAVWRATWPPRAAPDSEAPAATPAAIPAPGQLPGAEGPSDA